MQNKCKTRKRKNKNREQKDTTTNELARINGLKGTHFGPVNLFVVLLDMIVVVWKSRCCLLFVVVSCCLLLFAICFSYLANFLISRTIEAIIEQLPSGLCFLVETSQSCVNLIQFNLI